MTLRGVTPLQDISPADWLTEHPTECIAIVGQLVPPIYDAYARVLHRDVDDAQRPRRWAEVAAEHGTVLHPEAQFSWLHGEDPRGRHPLEAWGGSLDPWQLPLLRDVLARHTTTPDDCWFAKWHGYGSAPRAWQAFPTFELPAREYWLFHLPLRDVMDLSVELACAGADDLPGEGVADQFRAAGHLTSPSLWWPEDRAWVVATEVDLDSTVVAGSRALVDDLLAHDEVEALEVTPDSDLTIDGDHVNRR